MPFLDCLIKSGNDGLIRVYSRRVGSAHGIQKVSFRGRIRGVPQILKLPCRGDS